MDVPMVILSDSDEDTPRTPRREPSPEPGRKRKAKGPAGSETPPKRPSAQRQPVATVLLDSDDEDEVPWSCQACTSENVGSARKCSVCLFARGWDPNAATLDDGAGTSRGGGGGASSSRVALVEDGDLTGEPRENCSVCTAAPSEHKLDMCQHQLCTGCLKKDLSRQVEEVLQAPRRAPTKILGCPAKGCGEGLSARDARAIITGHRAELLASAVFPALATAFGPPRPVRTAPASANGTGTGTAGGRPCSVCKGLGTDPAASSPTNPDTVVMVARVGELCLSDARRAMRVRGLEYKGMDKSELAQAIRVAAGGSPALCIACDARSCHTCPEVFSGRALKTHKCDAGQQRARRVYNAVASLIKLRGDLEDNKSAEAGGGGGAAAPAAAAGRGQARGGRATRGGGRGRGRGRGSRGRGGSAWEAGVGYGGSNAQDSSAATMEAVKKAHEEEEKIDVKVAEALQELASAFAPPRPPVSIPEAALAGHPVLRRVLEEILLNDSMEDVCARAKVYRAAFALLRGIASSPDLAPVIAPPPAPAAGGGDGGGDGVSLLTALGNLGTQAQVFVSAMSSGAQGEGGGFDDDSMPEITMALEVSDTCQRIRNAAEELKARAPPPAAVAPPRSLRGGEGGGGGVGGKPGKREVGGGNDEARGRAYVESLRGEQFALVSGLAEGHTFKAQLQQGLGGEHGRTRVRHVSKEIATLATSLPLNPGSAILMRVDEAHNDVMRAVILPPPDTPYAHGAFVFDIFLPADYPNVPPKVQLLTTGGGRVRFNPNLYNCGKVCLSLLGTWQGPGWVPGQSTILQVLVSVQSLIFVPDPYFNEPGWEASRKTSHGQASSLAYNKNIRRDTLTHAVLPALASSLPPKHPLKPFEAALKLHFKGRREEIEAQCLTWGREDPSGAGAAARQVGAALDKYCRAA